jgi:hypothetical protein
LSAAAGLVLLMMVSGWVHRHKAVGRKALLELDTIVSPDTLLR